MSINACKKQKDTYLYRKQTVSFPGSSGGKEYACNAGDSGLISGLGRSPGEGIGYPLQYLWELCFSAFLEMPPRI